jgi:hypothetical protein
LVLANDFAAQAGGDAKPRIEVSLAHPRRGDGREVGRRGGRPDRELSIDRRPDRRGRGIRIRSQQRRVVSRVDQARSKDIQVAGADERLDRVEPLAGRTKGDLQVDRRAIRVGRGQATHRVVEQQFPPAGPRRQRRRVGRRTRRLEVAVGPVPNRQK